MAQGLYLKGAIQNSGVTRGNNGDVRITGNGGVQIYPREMPISYSNSSMGGCSCYFIGRRYGNNWQTPACQGYYNSVGGNGEERIGVFQWNGGKPTLPREN